MYIAHPISGNVQENIQSILSICKTIHSKKTIPFAPYLLALKYLKDDIPSERKKGIIASKPFFERKTMDETWLCGSTISTGMKKEIEWSLENNIPIKCYNPILQTEFEKLLQKNSYSFQK